MNNSQLQGTAPWPKGAIISWYGSISNKFDGTGKGINEMTGWALCNAKNGTPDLQDRFIIGAGHDYALEQAGGKVSTTIAVNQMPAHKHTILQVGPHKHGVPNNVYYNNVWFAAVQNSGNLALWGAVPNIDTYNGGEHTHDMDNTGAGDPVDILPPYYALYFIMRIE